MRTTDRRRVLVTGAVTATAVLALAACGSSSDTAASTPSATTSAAASTGASMGGTSLKGVCPDTVVIQTDWNPESEHGAIYQLVGPNPTVDTGKKIVTGPLMAGGTDTGVKVEIRVGGPAIGFQTVSAQMYTDKSITLGYVSTDEAVQLSKTQPTLAVVAPNEKSPMMLMWDPATYPDVKTIADLKAKNAKVLYFNGAAYMEYLLGQGVLSKSQVDGSYDGTPATFVASKGKAAQQGFATAEPYIYENEVSAWKKPVAYQLVADAGFDIYAQALAIRSADKATLSGCLKALVPIIQQAQVDYIKSPAAANTLILDLVKKYNTGWVYSQGVADFSVKKQLELGIVGNGDDTTLGNMKDDKVQKIIDAMKPILEKSGKPIKDGLTPADLGTNEFIDPKIGLS